MGDLRNVAHGMRCGLGNRLFCLSVFLIGLFPPNLTGNLDYFVSTADAATPVTAPVAWYVGLIAAKVTHGGRQIRLKVSVLHRWWRDFVHAWETIPTLDRAIPSG